MINKFFVVGDEVYIKLGSTDNFWTAIDLEDLEIVSSIDGLWYANKKQDRNIRYAFIAIPYKRNIIAMHRLILNLSRENNDVDHKDRDGLNNRRRNLRVVNIQISMFNRNLFKNNKSGITGVRYDKYRRRWEASIGINYKVILLGRFKRKEDAIEARSKAEDSYLP
jgi:hypothetical protein